MAFLDFLLTKGQKQARVATRIGVESGLFEMCPVCHDVTEAKTPQAHRAKTEELVQQLIRSGGPEAQLFNRKTEDLLRTIEEVARKLPYHCICQRI
jgi:hypothetical protein